MERVVEMMTFAKVVQMKSFSAAARELATSKSLISKQISALESSLGVRLLNRTTRSMSLTESGAAFYEHCARIAHAIEEAEQTVTQLQAAPRGVLKITTPVIFASLQLAPALQTFLKRYDQVQIDLDTTDRVVDLVEEGFDLAIRITGSPHPTMVARKIASVRWATCASPAYLKRHGTPRTPQELLQHQCLVYQGVPVPHSGWRYQVGGKHVTLPVSGRCRVNSSEVMLQMALNGMGIVLFPTYVLGAHLKKGRLVQILSDFEARSDSSLYATYMPTRYMQPKVRAFIDHLIEHFGPEPDWDRF